MWIVVWVDSCLGGVSKQSLGQKTVIWEMNKSRDDAGFDATQVSLFSYSSG